MKLCKAICIPLSIQEKGMPNGVYDPNAHDPCMFTTGVFQWMWSRCFRWWCISTDMVKAFPLRKFLNNYDDMWLSCYRGYNFVMDLSVSWFNLTLVSNNSQKRIYDSVLSFPRNWGFSQDYLIFKVVHS